ncbi:MAG: ferric reductase-like transmembrane domain-containing protein [Anaerolineae bacterium]|nr:ferric reductase-like transmembrane domain-containing protein [Anaerolineae bacterium]
MNKSIEGNLPPANGVISMKVMMLRRDSMAWLNSNWRWTAFNLFAVSTLVVVLTQGSTDSSNIDTFDPMLASGKWAIRFLLICLTITPLNTYFGWKGAIKLRKSSGLWAFGFASLHILLYIREAKLEWLRISMPFYLALGLTGIVILIALAATSNRWAMKQLGKNWKRLHRLVYLAGIAVVTHSMLAMTMSKKLLYRDPQAEYELKVYVVVLSILLVVRLPLVRHLLNQISAWLKNRKSKLKISRVAAPDGDVELWPKIHGRESSVSLKPTYIIPNEMPNPFERSSLGEPFGRINDPLESYDDGLSVEILTEDEGEVQEAIPN